MSMRHYILVSIYSQLKGRCPGCWEREPNAGYDYCYSCGGPGKVRSSLEKTGAYDRAREAQERREPPEGLSSPVLDYA